MIDANARYVKKGRVIFLEVGMCRDDICPVMDALGLASGDICLAIKLSMGEDKARFKVFNSKGESGYIYHSMNGWHVYSGYPASYKHREFDNVHIQFNGFIREEWRDKATEFTREALNAMDVGLFWRLFVNNDNTVVEDNREDNYLRNGKK